MRSVLITGASGMVGYAVCKEAIRNSMKVVGLGRKNRHRIPGVHFLQMDITNHAVVADAVKKAAPDLIVHLAANTNHADCERDPDAARKLHVAASEHLARLAGEMRSHIIHASTEAVYGNAREGYRKETDTCQPEGVYATTKLEAESRLLDANPEALILRITPVGLAHNGEGSTLAEWLIGQFEQNCEITGYEDVFFTPVSSDSLARLILNPGTTGISGIYNWGIRDVLSKHDFAVRLAETLGFNPALVRPGLKSSIGESFHGEMDSSLLSKALRVDPPSVDKLFTDLARSYRHKNSK